MRELLLMYISLMGICSMKFEVNPILGSSALLLQAFSSIDTSAEPTIRLKLSCIKRSRSQQLELGLAIYQEKSRIIEEISTIKGRWVKEKGSSPVFSW